MDEEEYRDYLDQIDSMYWGTPITNPEDDPLQEQLRDEDGYRVPGCYRTRPAPTI